MNKKHVLVELDTTISQQENKKKQRLTPNKPLSRRSANLKVSPLRLRDLHFRAKYSRLVIFSTTATTHETLTAIIMNATLVKKITILKASSGDFV